jgi:hypothetical protein
LFSSEVFVTDEDGEEWRLVPGDMASNEADCH